MLYEAHMVSVKNGQRKLIPSGILEACVYAEALSVVKTFYHEIMGLELVTEVEPSAATVRSNATVQRDDDTGVVCEWLFG